MNKEKGHPKAASKKHKQQNDSIIDNGLGAQRFRLMKALCAGPVTTIEARDVHNIMHPAGRVRELRARGFDIRTHWLVVHDSWGRPHRVGCYVLHRRPVQQAA